jgi:hypothetical protein
MATERLRADPYHVLQERLNGFTKLRRGWDGNSASPIPQAVIKKAWTLIVDAEEYAGSLPFVAPAVDETVLLEWQFGDRSVEFYVGGEESFDSVVLTDKAGAEDVTITSRKDLFSCLKKFAAG